MLQDEIANNTWALTFDFNLIQKLSVDDLLSFVSKLLVRRQQQISNFPVTFYLWFDAQALQLRFNIISGQVKHLPFGCVVHIVDSPKPILDHFMNVMLQVACEGDVMEFLDVDDDNDDEQDFVLDVYVKVLRAG